jgi:hypothetical protein
MSLHMVTAMIKWYLMGASISKKALTLLQNFYRSYGLSRVGAFAPRDEANKMNVFHRASAYPIPLHYFEIQLLGAYNVL